MSCTAYAGCRKVFEMWVLHGKLRAEFGEHGHEWPVSAIQLNLVVALAGLGVCVALPWGGILP